MKVTKNCYHHMRFLGSNATEMHWQPGLCVTYACALYGDKAFRVVVMRKEKIIQRNKRTVYYLKTVQQQKNKYMQ